MGVNPLPQKNLQDIEERWNSPCLVPRTLILKRFLRWYAAAANECYRGVLVKSNSGADPVAAAHAVQTILGVVVEDQLTANAEVLIHPAVGEIFESTLTRPQQKRPLP